VAINVLLSLVSSPLVATFTTVSFAVTLDVYILLQPICLGASELISGSIRYILSPCSNP